MNDSRDRAATGDLSGALRAVLPALERFLAFEGQDPARARSAWRAALDRRLPGEGIGRDAVLSELAHHVVGNGLRTGHPGFCGWVTTMPTDVGAAAHLAQAVAVPQRWWATAGTGEEALAALSRRHFDLVLMDCMLPGASGHEVTARWRVQEEAAGAHRTPIVALSADTSEANMLACRMAGMDEFASKPASLETLRQLLVRCSPPRPSRRADHSA